MNKVSLTRSIHLALCLCLLMVAYGCRSSKDTTTIYNEAVDTTASNNHNDINKQDASYNLLSQVASTYKEWSDVEIPVELELLKPRNFSVSGRATMIRNQSIYISIRALGFEAANIYINNDSIYAT